MLITYARMDSDAYDVAVYNFANGQHKTLDHRVLLPASFAAKDGSKVAYIVNDAERPGVYVAAQVP